jgi:hypothetical protein
VSQTTDDREAALERLRTLFRLFAGTNEIRRCFALRLDAVG